MLVEIFTQTYHFKRWLWLRRSWKNISFFFLFFLEREHTKPEKKKYRLLQKLSLLTSLARYIARGCNRVYLNTVSVQTRLRWLAVNNHMTGKLRCKLLEEEINLPKIIMSFYYLRTYLCFCWRRFALFCDDVLLFII